MAELLSDIFTKAEDNRSLDVPAQDLRGRYRIARASKKSFDAAQGDTVKLVALPSHAKLSAAISRIRYSAFGASVTLSIGFRDDLRPEVKAVTGGTGITSKTAALLSALDVSSAGSANAMGAVAIADEDKSLWELAGCTASPGVDLVLIATLGGANPASGTLVYEQGHVTD